MFNKLRSLFQPDPQPEGELNMTADTSALQAWANRLRDVLTIIHNPSQAIDNLGPPPTAGDPRERIAALRRLLHDLSWHEDSADPAGVVWQQINGRFGGGVAETVASLGKRLQGAIAHEASQMTGDPVVVLTADLPERALGYLRLGETWLATVHVNALPSEHWLRHVLPPSDCWPADGGAYLLLGPARRDSVHDRCHAAAWYGLDRVVALTRRHVEAKREEEAWRRRLRENQEAHLRQQEQQALAARAEQRRREEEALAQVGQLYRNEIEDTASARKINREARQRDLAILREQQAASAAKEVNDGR